MKPGCLLHYYPEDEAVKKFNVDTAITYVVELDDDELYKGKYRYLKALSKYNRWYFRYFFFLRKSARTF